MTHDDPTGRAFLKAICRAPDDDVPRLIYADWLDENGQPERAEYIRVHIDIAPRTPCSLTQKRRGGRDCCQFCFLRRRERELLDRHFCDWKSEFHDSFGWPHHHYFIGDVYFRRGFVEELSCSWEDWCRHAVAIRTSAPIRRVRLATRPWVLIDHATGLCRLDGNDRRCPWRMDPPDVGGWPNETQLLNRVYPGIEFELPRPGTSSRTSQFLELYT